MESGSGSVESCIGSTQDRLPATTRITKIPRHYRCIVGRTRVIRGVRRVIGRESNSIAMRFLRTQEVLHHVESLATEVVESLNVNCTW